MKHHSILPNLKEKIYDMQRNNHQVKITSYFPLTKEEKDVFSNGPSNHQISFKSIFSDTISVSEWSKNKNQIIKKFQNELIDIE